MRDKAYIEIVRLLLESAPAIFERPCFAMKGGTAINLFVEEMPRLSVDIDVVYTNHESTRDEAMAEIASGLETARKQLASLGLEAEVESSQGGGETKLFVRQGRHQVKIEVNHVFRGTVLPVETRRLGARARDLFTTDLSVPMLNEAELYGSKLVAALDRQHPRDLFDVLGLFARSGLSAGIVECFVCYLAGHNRPVHEVLFSNDLDTSIAFENEFTGMAQIPITLEELKAVRFKLRETLIPALTSNHRRFLLSLVGGEPEWGLMICPHLSRLPAVQWKLKNLLKLKRNNADKFARQTEELQKRLG